MNIISFGIMRVDPHAVPGLLWRSYVEHLWDYAPESWVGRTAYAFRVLAVLIVFPFLVLTLLDIASYVVVRTLGIVDGGPRAEKGRVGALGATTLSSVAAADSSLSVASAPSITIDGPESPSATQYFTSDEIVPRLSGVDVFSPAASQPPSPPCDRRSLSAEGKAAESVDRLDEQLTIRKRSRLEDRPGMISR